MHSDRLNRLNCLSRKIRTSIVKMGRDNKAIHLGGALSSVEILVSLYFEILRHHSSDPFWAERDRFILSKGHAVIGLYAVLAEAGYFSDTVLPSFKEFDSPLQGHPDMLMLPGLEMSTGSLGQGLSVGIGMALAAKIDLNPHRIFVLMGDGELDEGQVWEAAMAASHFKLNNLIGIIDRNGLQLDGKTEEIMALEPLAEKWKAFGWQVSEVNGHHYPELLNALGNAGQDEKKPTMIIARTIKGYGIPFVENQVSCHSMKLSADQMNHCLMALEK